MIEGGFQGGFDFLYIPYNFELGRNMGYGIVNFILPQQPVCFSSGFSPLVDVNDIDCTPMFIGAPSQDPWFPHGSYQDFGSWQLDAANTAGISRGELPPEL